jgi:uncharacterized membrane protein HdeD (DUF308 family)
VKSPELAAASLGTPMNMRSRSTLFILVGAVELVLGLIAIIWPAVAAVSIAILLGTLLLLQGGVALVSAFAARGWSLFRRLLLSFVSGLAGVYLLAYPEEGVVGLTVVLVLVLFAAGALALAAGLIGERQGVLIAGGLFDILIGALIWAHLPSSASWAIGLLVGLYFFASGIETMSFGLDVRREGRRGSVGEGAMAGA